MSVAARDREHGMRRRCSSCGCTDVNACVTDAGPCRWVLMDIATPTGLCSACVEETAQQAYAGDWRAAVLHLLIETVPL